MFSGTGSMTFGAGSVTSGAGSITLAYLQQRVNSWPISARLASTIFYSSKVTCYEISCLPLAGLVYISCSALVSVPLHVALHQLYM